MKKAYLDAANGYPNNGFYERVVLEADGNVFIQSATAGTYTMEEHDGEAILVAAVQHFNPMGGDDYLIDGLENFVGQGTWKKYLQWTEENDEEECIESFKQFDKELWYNFEADYLKHYCEIHGDNEIDRLYDQAYEYFNTLEEICVN